MAKTTARSKPKPKPIDRKAQQAASYAEKDLIREKKAYFWGCMKIQLHNLSFSHSSGREINDTNVTHLLSSFELAGSLRLDPTYHIPAVMDRAFLEIVLARVGANNDDLKSDDPSRWPMVELSPGAKVECLHGQQRIAAARRYLRKSDQWWAVDIYSSAISIALRDFLSVPKSYETPLSAGEIYFHILRCDPEDTEIIDSWLARIPTENGRKEVQHLYARKDLNAAFATLAEIPAFASSMLVGNIRALMGIKCDEEIKHYLMHVYESWLFFMDGDHTALAAIDHRSVEQVQSRCPANCLEDRRILQPMFENGSVFGMFDLATRLAIWERLLSYRRLLPSLQTFFQDLKYLRDLHRCVLYLVQPIRRQTIRQAFKASFVPEPTMNQEFDQAYRRVFLYAMKTLKDLLPESLLVERHERIDKRQKRYHAVYNFAREAQRLGFTSPQIEQILECDPDRAEARQFLARARPLDEFPLSLDQTEEYVRGIAQYIAPIQAGNASVSQPRLIVPGLGEDDVERRCGRPHRNAFEESAAFMSLENVHMADTTEVGSLSAFNIRRDVYLSFFGSRLDEGAVHAADAGQDPYPNIERAETAGVEGAPHHDVAPLLDLVLASRESLHPSTPNSLREVGADVRADVADSYSASHYTDQSLPDEESTPPAALPWTSVRFVSGMPNDRRTLDEVVLHDRNDSAIEQIAQRYRRDGYMLFDHQGRSINPSQCLAAALDSEERTIIVVERRQTDVFLATKRKASDELDRRPRKFLVVAPNQQQ